MSKQLASFAFIWLLASAPAAAQKEELWDHNGSTMRLVHEDSGFGIYYKTVRSGLKGTVPVGAPRFRGRVEDKQIIGKAYVYTKYCPKKEFEYLVKGPVKSPDVIELRGPAPVVDPDTCKIVEYRKKSGNAHLVFERIPLPAPPAPSSSDTKSSTPPKP
jgi:hypothetical protein